jgi:LmbE family N-acetylglucosaminyl deacetylase
VRVLAIGAHPDDLELQCAGTLTKYAEAGHQVVMCCVACGDTGHYRIPAKELAETRHVEAQSSADVIGAELIWLGLHDHHVYAEDPETRSLFVDMMRRANPDLVIAHHPADYMSDHVAAGQLAVYATWAVASPHYVTAHPAIGREPRVLYMETYLGIGFQPQEYVDITDHMGTKLAMMSQHASQISWLKEHGDLDVLEQIETAGRFRGYQSGVRYAEGFVPHRAANRQATRRLLP